MKLYLLLDRQPYVPSMMVIFFKTPDLNAAVDIEISFSSSHFLSVQSQVTFRWWKISLRSEYRSTKPGETKETHEDFLKNSHLQGKEGNILCKLAALKFSLVSDRFCQ